MKRPAKAMSRTKEFKVARSRNEGASGSDADAMQRDIGETRGVLVHVPLKEWRALKHLSVDQVKTLQVLMMEAIMLLLDHNSPAKGEQ
jgi:hypothetical protein